MPDKINFALVGCGAYGRKRAESIVKVQNEARLLKVYDIDRARSEEFSLEFDARCALSLGSISSDRRIDAVIVSVPNAFHYEICRALVPVRKHILCEKPISHTIETARKLRDLLKEREVLFKCGSNFRNFPVVTKISEIVAAGKIGAVRYIYGSIGHNGDIIRNKWNLLMNIAGGGTLLDNGIHLIDFFQHIAGEFIVNSVIEKEVLNNGIESYALLKYASSSVPEIVIESSWKKKSGYADIIIEGTEGSISAEVSGKSVRLKNGSGSIELFVSDKKKSHELELDYFIDCVKNNIQPEPSAETALTNLEKIFMAYNN